VAPTVRKIINEMIPRLGIEPEIDIAGKWNKIVTTCEFN
jgi:hypothetical protein